MAAMTELAFARQFLTALDSRPTKLSSDHISDPKQYPAQGAYTLPRLPSQPQKKRKLDNTTSSSTSSADPTLRISLKNSKSPEASYTLPDLPLTTSIYDLKSQYSSKSGAALDKIKLLYNKKPTSDSKTLRDLLGDDAKEEVEFTVMVMGGIPVGASPRIQSPVLAAVGSVPVAGGSGSAGLDVLKEESFWNDLQGFLQQRIRDEEEAGRLAGLFRSAWQKGAA